MTRNIECAALRHASDHARTGAIPGGHPLGSESDDVLRHFRIMRLEDGGAAHDTLVHAP